ncbi:hypothetical protein TUMEXPCC7403_09125 [Tumidithrix helvetica PCC 7403]
MLLCLQIRVNFITALCIIYYGFEFGIAVYKDVTFLDERR